MWIARLPAKMTLLKSFGQSQYERLSELRCRMRGHYLPLSSRVCKVTIIFPIRKENGQNSYYLTIFLYFCTQIGTKKIIMADLIQNFKATTINEALKNIASRKYLLPAIQRKFVWKSEQIEKLFDSILQGYPINTFMLWQITDKRIKNDFKFYDFLQDYIEHFHEDNEPHKSQKESFFAVIDGQQRLTSLYIGLQGTYAYKMPRVWYINCPENFPKRKLYLDLSGEYQNDNDERKLKFNFKFLSDADIDKSIDKGEQEWFCLHDLFRYNDEGDFLEYVYSHEWKNLSFARKWLPTLYRKIFKKLLRILIKKLVQ